MKSVVHAGPSQPMRGFSSHPLRLPRRYMGVSDLNPAVKAVAGLRAGGARGAQAPLAPANPFFQTEKLFAAMVEQGLNFSPRHQGDDR